MFKTVPGTFPFQPERKPPVDNSGIAGWAKQNLFSSPFNTILTLISACVLYLTIPNLVNWAIIDASWGYGDRHLCEEAGGACWTYVRVRAERIFFGPFYGQNKPEI